jgi:hypothetical protein
MVKIECSEDHEYTRNIKTVDGILLSSEIVMPMFRNKFILRRHDILQFWQTAPSKRQLLFMNYHFRQENKESVSLSDNLCK